LERSSTVQFALGWLFPALFSITDSIPCLGRIGGLSSLFVCLLRYPDLADAFIKNDFVFVIIWERRLSATEKRLIRKSIIPANVPARVFIKSWTNVIICVHLYLICCKFQMILENTEVRWCLHYCEELFTPTNNESL